jgi:putative ABC transport system permease protein
MTPASPVHRRLGLWLGAVLSLSLALGGALAVFAIVDRTLLNPLPYPGQEEIVRVLREQGPEGIGPPVSGPAFLDLAREQDVFSAFAASAAGSMVMAGDAAATRVSAAQVSAQWFDVIGLGAQTGRLIGARDFEAGAADVAVLSHAAWRDRFGADPGVLGRRVLLDGRRHEIVGIAPEDLLLPARAEFAVPLRLAADGGSRGNNWLILTARLAPGVALDAAQARLDALATGLARSHPDNHAALRLRAVRLGELLTEDTAAVVELLSAAIGLLLLVGAASLANLVLADAHARRREFATRLALGAARRRLLGQLLRETTAQVAVAAVVGVALGWAALRLLLGSDPDWIARPERIGIGALPLVAVAVLSLLLALGAAWLAARHLLRESGTDGLRLNVRSPTLDRGRQRLRRGLVVAQIALSLALLVGAGLLTESLRRVLAEDPGFASAGLWTGHLSLPPEMLQQGGDATDDAARLARAQAFIARAEAAVRALPGVSEAGFAFRAPIVDGPGSNGDLTIEGDPAFEAGRAPLVEFQMASPGYFRAMGLPLLAGRMFPEPGTPAGDVLLVNDALVARHFAGREALGARLRIADGRSREIVGVVRGVRQGGLDASVRPEAYFAWDAFSITPDISLLVRTAGDVAALTPAIRARIAEVDPAVPVFAVQSMDEAIAVRTGQRRFLMAVMQFFALTALAIAVVGLHALASHAVALRTPEFGVRLALGATARSLARLVAAEGARLVGTGLAVGLAAAAGLAFALRGSLYGVEAAEPGVYLVLSAVLAVAAAVALLPPTLRAARTAPLEALRDE